MWAAIGWKLGNIRLARKQPNLVAVRKAVYALRGVRDHYVLTYVLWPTPKASTDKEIRHARRQLSNAVQGSREAENALKRHQLSWQESAQAVAIATQRNQLTQKAAAQKEHRKRTAELRQSKKALSAAMSERESWQKDLQDREGFFTQREMLDFLSRKRYALTPRNLAGALAGTPYLRWRQSINRREKVQCDMAVSINHQAFLAVSWVLDRSRPRRTSDAVLFFKNTIPKLPKCHVRARSFLIENWHHLRGAVEDCWKLCPFRLKLPSISPSASLHASIGPQTLWTGFWLLNEVTDKAILWANRRR
jgi:hypothetical protein